MQLKRDSMSRLRGSALRKDKIMSANWRKRDSRDLTMSVVNAETRVKSARKRLSKEKRRPIKHAVRLSSSMHVPMSMSGPEMIREQIKLTASWTSTQA